MLVARDVQVVQVVLDGISNILKVAGDQLEEVVSAIEACGGLNHIEDLQSSANETVFSLAYNILETYFGAVSYNLYTSHVYVPIFC